MNIAYIFIFTCVPTFSPLSRILVLFNMTFPCVCVCTPLCPRSHIYVTYQWYTKPKSYRGVGIRVSRPSKNHPRDYHIWYLYNLTSTAHYISGVLTSLSLSIQLEFPNKMRTPPIYGDSELNWVQWLLRGK